MDGKKEAAATTTSDGTILKPFLMDGGRFVVESDLADGIENMMFSVRGVIDYKHISDVFQTAENFLREAVSDSRRSGSR